MPFPPSFSSAPAGYSTGTCSPLTRPPPARPPLARPSPARPPPARPPLARPLVLVLLLLVLLLLLFVLVLLVLLPLLLLLLVLLCLSGAGAGWRLPGAVRLPVRQWLTAVVGGADQMGAGDGIFEVNVTRVVKSSL